MSIIANSLIDFDPEALEQDHWGGEGSDESGVSGDEGEYNGREHYVVVGYVFFPLSWWHPVSW